MSETFICSFCKQEHSVMVRIIFGGQMMCQACAETETCVCDHCGIRVWAADSCGDENHSLCRACERHYYRRCTDCGKLIPTNKLWYLAGNKCEGFCEPCYTYRIKVQVSQQ